MAASIAQAVPDQYIQDLKGAVYLLTVENDMLKGSQQQQQQAGGIGINGSGQSFMQRGDTRMYPNPGNAPSPIGPTHSLSDLEAAMRSRYDSQASGYEREAGDLRRANEALAQQNAANAALVAALQSELDSAHELATKHNDILQTSQIADAVKIERAAVEAEALRATIARIEKETASVRASLDAKIAEAAEMKSRLDAEAVTLATAEAQRVENAQRLARAVIAQQAAEAVVDKIREARDAAEADAAAVSVPSLHLAGYASVEPLRSALPGAPGFTPTPPCIHTYFSARRPARTSTARRSARRRRSRAPS